MPEKETVQNKFPSNSCLTCSCFFVQIDTIDREDNIISDPTGSSHQPHLCGQCKNCPYTNAYGCPEKEQGIIINLITGETWVDGSERVENCPNYKISVLL